MSRNVYGKVRARNTNLSFVTSVEVIKTVKKYREKARHLTWVKVHRLERRERKNLKNNQSSASLTLKM